MDKLFWGFQIASVISIMAAIMIVGTVILQVISAATDEQEKAGSTTMKNVGEDNNTDVKITCTENVEGLVEKCG